MSTLPGFEIVRDALRNTIVGEWADKIATVNALRTVKIRSSKTENYTVPAGSSIILEVDSVAMPVAPTSGARTAAQLVIDFDAAIAALSCNDDSGAFELVHGTAPSGTTDRKIKVVSDANGLAGALGFSIGDMEHRAPLLPLPRHHFYDYIPHLYNLQPFVTIEQLEFEGPAHHRDKSLNWIPIRLALGAAYRGGSYRPTLDLLLGYGRAVREILEENNRLGTTGNAQEVINTRVERMQARPTLYQSDEGSPVFGRVQIDLRIRTWNA